MNINEDCLIAVIRMLDVKSVMLLKNTSKKMKRFIKNNWLMIFKDDLESTYLNIRSRIPLPYQMLMFLDTRKTIWNVEMGLGKTTAALLRLKKTKNNLLVCPANIIRVWEEQMNNYFPKMTYAKKMGNVFCPLIAKSHNLYLVSYSSLLTNDDIKNHKWDTIILDESHKINNMKTSTYKSVMKLKGNNKIAMSGTIIKNNGTEINAISTFMGFEPNTNRYYNHFCKVGVKDTIITYPQLNTITYEISLTGERANNYRALKENFVNEYQKYKNGFSDIANVGAHFMTLRRYCVIPGVIMDTSTHPELNNNNDPKLNIIKRVIANTKSKVIIMSKFTSALNYVQKLLGGVVLSGFIPGNKRKALIDDFKTSNHKILFANTDVASEGIDLTFSNVLILLEPWWNYASDEQAIARIRRIGQTKPCVVHKLLIYDSIEMEMVNICKEKKQSSYKVESGTFYSRFL